MNKSYRLIWSETTGAWVAVSEVAKSAGKRSTAKRLLVALSTAAAGALSVQAFAADPAPTALPTGGQVAAGVASIGQSGANMVINQSSDKLITNWQSFNIGKDASVTFNQPSSSSAALNRVTSQDPTQILGRLSANGQVMIVNPAGVVFGKGSQVDVGALTASTLNISDADFLAGKHRFAGDGSGQVLNQGKITTPSGGRVVFIAPVVSNEGEIRTPQGTTALAAGRAVDMDINGDGSLVIRVTQGAINALAENKHLIQADEGTVILTAKAFDALTRAAVKNSGVIEAKGLSRKGGRLILGGGPNTDVTNTGTLDVSSVNHAGGSIDISGAKVSLGGTANASGTTGGSISVSATESLVVTGTLDVRGTTGAGGTIQLTAAHTLSIAPVATTASPAPRLDARGTTDGGQIAVTAGSEAHIEGELIAAADANSGGEILLNAQHITLSQATLDVSGGLQGGRITLKAATPVAGWLDPANPINDPTAPPSAPPHVAVLSGSALRSNSRSGRGGRVTIEGENITLASGSAIEATGESGGGEVLVGGDWQGGASEEFRVFDDPNALHQATTVTMEAGASIDVSATKVGAGGTAVLWSDINNADSLTTVKGTIHAFGGAEGGDGGKIETSAQHVDLAGASVSAAAPLGNGGLWLIDPTYNNANTVQSDANTYAASLNTGTSVQVIVTGGELKIETNVSINKTAGGNATFTLKSDGHILLQSGSRITSSAGALNVVLWSNSDGSADGAIRLEGSNTITTNGGQLYMGGGSASTTWNGLTVPSGFAYSNSTGRYGEGLLIAGSSSISTSGGNVEMRGQTANGSNARGIEIWNSQIITTSGSIALYGIATSSGDSGAYGVWLRSGGVLQTGTGAIDVTGWGGSASTTYGIALSEGSNSRIQSSSGAITLTGIRQGSNTGIYLDSSTAKLGKGSLGSSSSAITLITDELSIAGSSNVQSTGSLTLKPYTGIGINVTTGTTSRLQILPSYFTSNFVNGFSSITLGSSGSGLLDVSSALSFNDPLTLQGSDIVLAANLTTSGNSLTLSNSSSSSYLNSGVTVSLGSGSLVKSGAGTFKINGAMSYTGATSINQGSIRSQIDNALPDTTDMTIASGASYSLRVNDTTTTLGSSDTIGSIAGAGDVYLPESVSCSSKTH